MRLTIKQRPDQKLEDDQTLQECGISQNEALVVQPNRRAFLCKEQLERKLPANDQEDSCVILNSDCKSCPKCDNPLIRKYTHSNKAVCVKCDEHYCFRCLKEWSLDCKFIDCEPKQSEGKVRSSSPRPIKNVGLIDQPLDLVKNQPPVKKIRMKNVVKAA